MGLKWLANPATFIWTLSSVALSWSMMSCFSVMWPDMWLCYKKLWEYHSETTKKGIALSWNKLFQRRSTLHFFLQIGLSLPIWSLNIAAKNNLMASETFNGCGLYNRETNPGTATWFRNAIASQPIILHINRNHMHLPRDCRCKLALS